MYVIDPFMVKLTYGSFKKNSLPFKSDLTDSGKIFSSAPPSSAIARIANNNLNIFIN